MQLLGLCESMAEEGEQTVLSIPAASSIEFIERTLIHACPDEPPYNRYRRTRYMTFRSKGSEMKEVFEIDLAAKFQPSVRCIPKGMRLSYRKRLANYIRLRRKHCVFGGSCDYTFYVLSKKHRIRLPHRPRKRAQGHCYFLLDDLRTGGKEPKVAPRE